jgi:hypothetical protein
MGVQLFDVQELEAYIDDRGTASAYGGSAVQTGSGLGGIGMGVVNVLFRPFLFEARGIAAFIAAAEVTALWGLALWNRKAILGFYRAHRTSRLMWFAIIFMAVYVLLTGMTLGNLGLIARQRVHIFPFLLMFFAGPPVVRRLTASLSRGAVGGSPRGQPV